ncbi:MAG: hypothetical protein LBE91_09155, partial [Tannerella sp.]|nr:hypothetical protein [Tannerella sp.]
CSYRVPTAHKTGGTLHFYQYSVPNGTSGFRKNFRELNSPALLGGLLRSRGVVARLSVHPFIQK